MTISNETLVKEIKHFADYDKSIKLGIKPIIEEIDLDHIIGTYSADFAVVSAIMAALDIYYAG